MRAASLTLTLLTLTQPANASEAASGSAHTAAFCVPSRAWPAPPGTLLEPTAGQGRLCVHPPWASINVPALCCFSQGEPTTCRGGEHMAAIASTALHPHPQGGTHWTHWAIVLESTVAALREEGGPQ